MSDHERRRASARATITIRNFKTRPYDQTASPALMEIHLTETFSGDIEAEGSARALQVLFDDKSAHLVSLERVRGTLGGRHGTFVLQGSESVANGRIKARWSVVPGSGTGDLAGLRGRVVSKVSSGRAPRGRWITGSNDRQQSVSHQRGLGNGFVVISKT